jgi:hypothetical protein
MVTPEIDEFVRPAERFYNERLRSQLEESHPDEFVALEPVSGEYFLGRTLSEAMGAAKAKYPNRFSHAFRVGHEAALHFGVSLR